MEALPKHLALTKLRGVLMSLDLESITNVRFTCAVTS